MSTDTTEKGLESHISQYLVKKNKYLLRENKAYNNVNPTLGVGASILT
jgi:type I restriction enzyme, R subunit